MAGGTTRRGGAQADALRLERVLHAPGDPVRAGIAMRLHRREESRCAAPDEGRPKSMARQLRVLREAGLVRTRGQGVAHLNTLSRDRVDAAFLGLPDVILGAAGRGG